MITKPPRAAIYARVSSDEQVEAGTIQNQTDFAGRYCELHGIVIHDYYNDEGVGGTLAVDKRPAGKRLLADAKAGKFQLVLIYRIDRLARSTLHLLNAHETLKAAGVALRSMTEPFDTATPLGEFVMTLLGSLASLERATILERTALGRSRAIRDGRWLGGLPPFGYQVTEGRLAIEPSEAEVVRRIFQLYVNEDMGLIPILNLLNAEDVPSPYQHRGIVTKRWPGSVRRWNSGTVSRILRDTAYAGTYRVGACSKQDLGEYSVPAIVDRQTFDRAQQLMRERFLGASRNSKRLYLLRGLIKCHCGYTIVGNSNPKRNQYYYTCPRKHFRMRAEPLEELVWRDVVSFAHNPSDAMTQLREQLSAHVHEAEDVTAESADVTKLITTKRAEQDSVITLYRKSKISEVQLDTQLATLNAEIEALEARQQTLFARQAQAQAREVSLLSAEATLAGLQQRIDDIECGNSAEQKHEIIKSLVDRITVNEAGELAIDYCFTPRCSTHESACAEQCVLMSRVALVTAPEYARMLGRSRSYAHRLCRNEEIPVLRPGTGRYYVMVRL